MYKIIYLTLLYFLFFLAPIAHADNQSAFPFDQDCLTYNQANFKVRESLLAVMKDGDFPQYCVLYALSDYKILEKTTDGYFIAPSALKGVQMQAGIVFLRTNKNYKPDLVLHGNSVDNKPLGQWAYFLDSKRLAMAGAQERDFYVFEEIDF